MLVPVSGSCCLPLPHTFGLMWSWRQREGGREQNHFFGLVSTSWKRLLSGSISLGKISPPPQRNCFPTSSSCDSTTTTVVDAIAAHDWSSPAVMSHRGWGSREERASWGKLSSPLSSQAVTAKNALFYFLKILETHSSVFFISTTDDSYYISYSDCTPCLSQ